MCRFLIAKGKKNFVLSDLVLSFAKMAQLSRTLDGDWQGDGWGIALKPDGVKVVSGFERRQNWLVYKSLKPIWQDKVIYNLPPSRFVVVHARSASFLAHKGVIEFNQPYLISGKIFVFNGYIKGVQLNRSVKGKIGAQKIAYLVDDWLKRCPNEPIKAVTEVIELIKKASRKVVAFNLGLVLGDKILVYSNYADDQKADYYNLRLYQDKQIKLVVSEPIDYPFMRVSQSDFRPIDKGKLVIL